MVCQHVHATGRKCETPLDDEDTHAVHCSLGGGPVARHAAVARTLGSIMWDLTGLPAQYEQRVPQLDKQGADGEVVRAIMDVVGTSTSGAQVLVDVAVVSARAGSRAQREAAAKRPGLAAERAVAVKWQRYGENVIPFVLEVAGRPSAPAMQFVRKMLAEQAGADAPRQGAKVWARISCTVQRYVALQRQAAEAP